MTKSDNAFPWVSAHISGSNIGAPIEYVHSILHVHTHSTQQPLSITIYCALPYVARRVKRGLMTTDGQIPIEKLYRS